MAESEVAICNQALGWLGGDLIISLNDDTKEAKLCKANYANLRDAVLTVREWTFAVDRIEPSALATDPRYGFDKRFQIPGNVLRVLQVSRAGDDVVESSVGSSSGNRSSARNGTGLGREARVEWLREGETIVVNNAERIYARVLIRIVDPTKFSAPFDQALAARLAMDLAIPLTNSRLLQRDMAALYGEKLADAASTDGMQGRSTNTRADSLTVVR